MSTRPRPPGVASSRRVGRTLTGTCKGSKAGLASADGDAERPAGFRGFQPNFRGGLAGRRMRANVGDRLGESQVHAKPVALARAEIGQDFLEPGGETREFVRGRAQVERPGSGRAPRSRGHPAERALACRFEVVEHGNDGRDARDRQGFAHEAGRPVEGPVCRRGPAGPWRS